MGERELKKKLKIKRKLRIEVGKFYVTRSGDKARIYARDGNGVYSIHGAVLVWSAQEWVHDGRWLQDAHNTALDIVGVWDEKS